MLAVGLIGFGWVNRTVWWPRIEAHPRLELCGVYDPVAGADVPQRCDRLEHLWARRPDVVIVGTPNDTHCGLACEALERGVHVQVEKPLCLSPGQLRRMVERTGAAGLLVSRAAPRRSDVRLLAEQIPDEPLQVSVSWLRSRGVPRPGSWFTSRDRAGGGAMLDLGWHLADVALGLLRHREPTAVRARLVVPGAAGSKAPSAPPADAGGGSADGPADGSGAAWRGDAPAADGVIDVETDGTLDAGFADGSRLTLRAAWASDVPVDTTTVRVEAGPWLWQLRTTFGFSPHRVTEPTLTVRGPSVSTCTALEPQVGEEYDEQLDELVALASGGQGWRSELPRCWSVLNLLDAAYSHAGRPLRRAPAGVAREG